MISDLSSWDVSGQEKSPRALILKGFVIFPGLLGTLLDLPDGGEEEDRTPDLRIANATLSQLSYPPTAAASLAFGRRSTIRLGSIGSAQKATAGRQQPVIFSTTIGCGMMLTSTTEFR